MRKWIFLPLLGLCGCSSTSEIPACDGFHCAEQVAGRICSEEDIRPFLDGSGPLPETCVGGVVAITDTIRIHRDHFALDGKSQLVLQWAGEDQCSAKSKAKPLIEIQGNFNKVMNLELRGNADGIHVLEGLNNQILGIRFESLCRHAIVNGFKNRGKEAYNTVIAQSEFRGPGTRANAIAVDSGSVLIEESRFESFHVPIEATDHTKVVIRNTRIQGTKEDCEAGIRIRGFARLFARENSVSGCAHGISALQDARARVENIRFSEVGRAFEEKDRASIENIR